MNTNHLSAWEQEEYVLNERTPQMLQHLRECAPCRAAVEQLQQGAATYRGAAMEWSAACLATRPQPVIRWHRRPVIALRWALAAAIPLVLLLLASVPLHFSKPEPAQPVAQISDDALLEQVDEQLSVAVPSSMESLTHLVSAESNDRSGAATTTALGSKPIVQTN
jgi:hypothetical protein